MKEEGNKAGIHCKIYIMLKIFIINVSYYRANYDFGDSFISSEIKYETKCLLITGLISYNYLCNKLIIYSQRNIKYFLNT